MKWSKWLSPNSPAVKNGLDHVDIGRSKILKNLCFINLGIFFSNLSIREKCALHFL